MIEQLWLFHCGFFRAPAKIIGSHGSWKIKKFPFIALIAEHSKFGPIVVDAPFGHDGFSGASLLMAMSCPTFQNEWSIIERIREIGFRAADIDHVLMTHLHFDHTGGMKELAHAQFIVHAPEWEHANSDNIELGFNPDDYKALQDIQKFSLPEDKDIFEDGSVIAVDLRGHTPGHVGYRFNLSNGETYFHAGDASYTLSQITGGEALANLSKMTCSDFDQAVGSLQTLRQIAKKEPKIKWITSHDFDLGQRCEKGPIPLIKK